MYANYNRQYSIAMTTFLRAHLQAVAWTLTAATASLAIIVWGETLNWDTANLTAYSLFPLLGLLAFSIMWSQYMAGAVRRLVHGEPTTLARFSLISGSVVTAVVLLHPLTLIFKLWQDGAGLPPNSYLHYVMPNLKWAVMLGSISLFIFLAFELRHRFHDRSWWRFVDYINDAAIVAVYIHAYNLGTHTQFAWFRPVWFFYGITLSIALLYKYWLIAKVWSTAPLKPTNKS